MPLDSATNDFIESNLQYYREVTLATREFESQVESMLREVWGDYRRELAAVGLAGKKPERNLKQYDPDLFVNLFAQDKRGVEISISLNFADESPRFSAWSGVFVKDAELRQTVNASIRKGTPVAFEIDIRAKETYIIARSDSEECSSLRKMLFESFRQLFKCLWKSPDFCAAYPPPPPRPAIHT